MRKFVFFVLSSIVVFCVTVFFRVGGHKTVEITEANYPDIHLLYQEHFGAYHKINDVISQVEKWAAAHNLSCSRTFGEYLDDPRTQDERRLRSYGGCVIAAPISPSELTGDLKFKTVPSRKILLAKFAGAPSIGPMKVYPAVEDWLREHKMKITGPVIEIYTITGDRSALTEYLFPVE